MPIAATDGDVFAGVVDGRWLGAVVPPGDVPALTTVLFDFAVDTLRGRGSGGDARVLDALTQVR